MNQYWVDLHIHTALSPLAHTEMTPPAIVRHAVKNGLSAIAITDYNSTLQCHAVQTLGTAAGLVVFAGVEVITQEEVHCIVFFPSEEARQEFQFYLDKYIPALPNNPERFGRQVWVDHEGTTRGQYPYILTSAIEQSIYEVALFAHQLGCLFVPAHIEDPFCGIIRLLGTINSQLPVNAVEYHNLNAFESLVVNHPYLEHYTPYSASGAYRCEQIGDPCALITAPSLCFDDLRKAFLRQDGCMITSVFEEDFY